ncbi:hypothetical protein SAMN05444161_5841 [Rhizobiales bacterium GAS191]|nr:hypothetical protein SAMN05444161_5841 [Rhizobiales bacterium GAS191]
MTLVVAAIADHSIWMVGDTAVTGGTIDLRERKFVPKIEIGRRFPALIGFAGDPEIGARIARAAGAAETHDGAMRLLCEGSADGGVDFAYATFLAGSPSLFRIVGGASTSHTTLHIGLNDAFEQFQRIRRGEEIAYAPKAFASFMGAARNTQIPESLSLAIRSLVDLFAMREEHDVGGWAVPYLLNSDGAIFCQYSYSVSDPLFDKLAAGSLIGHGTPEGGGSTLSVTEFGSNEGMVVYWLQMPGGTVLIWTPNGYEERFFSGGPSAFKAEVLSALSRDVELWAGDQPLGPPRRLSISRGRNGNLDFTVADHGNGLTFAVHNMATPFHSRVTMAANKAQARELPAGMALAKSSNETVELTVDGKIQTLNANELESLLFRLAEIRAEIWPVVPYDIGGVSVIAEINPKWQTYPELHPGVSGITVNLRHSGYGWLGFVLPHSEARSLGTWLRDNAKSEEGPTTSRGA